MTKLKGYFFYHILPSFYIVPSNHRCTRTQVFSTLVLELNRKV